jgi:cellulose synthase/poly-beta-1,6-N-acetylglucosamine synthase-like glycosyltransferase
MMLSVADSLLTILACLLAIPVAVLVLEIVAAIFQPARMAVPQRLRSVDERVAVVIPAHNESTGVPPAIRDIKAQLRPQDRLIVVADNCTDDTAAVAAAAGADVIERIDTARIGKGYALDFAINHLAKDPPAVVIFIDADCRVAEGSTEHLASICLATGRPAQSLDLMTAPAESKINYRAAEFAWRVKNWVRPLGLRALGLPCQLMGTGMAFPWAIARTANLASGSIVEDLKLGLELAAAGHAAVFCPSALVTSQFPTSAAGAASQRKRWEGGHIHMIMTQVPRLLAKALVHGNGNLLALTLDLAIPPLALLVMMLVTITLIGAVAAILGTSSIAFVVSLSSLIVTLAAALLAWFKFGRDVLPPRSLPALISYVAGKLPLYGRLVSGNADAHWTRADRGKKHDATG